MTQVIHHDNNQLPNIIVGRDLVLDTIKAFATLLVIVGHVIQYTNVDFDNSFFFKIIYSFHMPLFMFISGYLMPKITGEGFLLLKFRQLVVPFILWSVLLISLNNPVLIQTGDIYQFLDRFYQLFLRPDDGGLWFLWVLFLNVLVFTLLEGKYRIILSFIIIAALTLLQFINRDFTLFGLGLFRWHYFFFVFGFLERNEGILTKIKINNWIILIATLALMTQWDRVAITHYFGIAINSNGLIALVTLIVKYLCALGAIVIVFSLKRRLNITNRWINILSTESLAYYATQFLFFAFFALFWSLKDLNGYIDQFYIFILISSCSTVMIVFLKSYSFTKKYLLGKVSKNKLFQI
jgi:fucose 4-O-acetylase-like acetyltransferase